MRRTLALDVEAVADADMARRVIGDAALSDEEALSRVAPPRRPGEVWRFPKPLYWRVVAIAVGLVSAAGELEELKCIEGETEEELLTGFWRGFGALARRGARIVTFNGRGFDLPVLVERALFHRISTRPYLADRDFLQRYGDRHLDVMDAFSNFRAHTVLSQQELATVLHIPGKPGMTGADVAGLYEKGDLATIREYCLNDVATLLLILARLGPDAGWLRTEEGGRLEASLRRRLREAGTTIPAAFAEED